MNFINRIISYKLEIANIDDCGKLPVYNESKKSESYELNQAKTLGWLNDTAEKRGKWNIYKERRRKNNKE